MWQNYSHSITTLFSRIRFSALLLMYNFQSGIPLFFLNFLVHAETN